MNSSSAEKNDSSEVRHSSEEHFLYLLLIKTQTCKFITVGTMMKKLRIITFIYNELWLSGMLKHLSGTEPKSKKY